MRRDEDEQQQEADDVEAEDDRGHAERGASLPRLEGAGEPH